MRLTTTSAARLALAVSVLVSLVALLQPNARVATDVVIHTSDLMTRLGAPPGFALPSRVEALLNVALFVPLALLTVVAFPRVSWVAVVALGLLTSLGVEAIQAVAVAGRTPQLVDVITNTLGALIGAALGAVVRLSTRPGSRSGVPHS